MIVIIIIYFEMKNTKRLFNNLIETYSITKIDIYNKKKILKTLENWSSTSIS